MSGVPPKGPIWGTSARFIPQGWPWVRENPSTFPEAEIRTEKNLSPTLCTGRTIGLLPPGRRRVMTGARSGEAQDLQVLIRSGPDGIDGRV